MPQLHFLDVMRLRVLPSDGAQQGGSGLVVEGDDDGSWREIGVIMKSGAPTEREVDG